MSSCSGGSGVLAVAGEIDLTSSEQLAVAVRDVVTRGDIDRITLDLDQLTFLDSMGIHALMDVKSWASEHGVVLRVSNPHNMVHRVLAITGVLTELMDEPQRSSVQQADF
ncbi:STAS domain-containing protein [Hamadaea sp. NPDC050747]|uniref:STAS domain-containing protein n=1 Tax=Hamadaea sp. NPDC050747 TaxID=3155789 RepID=UPI0033E9A6B7